MMYKYMELPDETLITHSQIIEEDVFDSARAELLSYKWIFNKGYSEKEIAIVGGK